MTVDDPYKIRLAYYESDNCPYIVVFGPMQVDLQHLKTCFKKLGEVEGYVAFDKAPFVFSAGVVLHLQSVRKNAKHQSIPPRLGLKRRKSHDVAFTWTQTLDRWQEMAELVEGLIEADYPAHQYLTMYPNDDATVVVSKGEYTDDLLEK